nr:DUF2155 domain-containing protein [Allosphingosinicella vermicomposti]
MGDPETVDVPQTVEKLAPGTTPMAERVAVLGFLNKRNGIARDVTLKPGQAVRVGDFIVRLRACETTAPYEVQQLTGAFVQLDVPGTDGQYRRVFSGWLYKESPSLNVVEHPVYDVWPKSCAMTHPAGAESAPSAAPSTASSAPKSGPAVGEAAVEEASPPVAAPMRESPAPSDNATPSNPT